MLHIKLALVAVCSKQKFLSPVRSLLHQVAYLLHGSVRIALYDDFIVNVSDDVHVIHSRHRVQQKVSCDALRDVLNKLCTVGFEPQPLLVVSDAFIGDDRLAVVVLLYLWSDVSKPAT